MKKLETYKITIDDIDLGMMACSLVEDPAMEIHLILKRI
jgi:hypothetical protein